MSLLNATSNITNVTDTIGTELPKLTKFTNICVIMITILNILLQCTPVPVLLKCKKVPVQIIHLLCNVVFSECLVSVVIISMSSAILILGNAYYDVICLIRCVSIVIVSSVTWASVAGLTLERLLALFMTMKYASLLNKHNCRVMTSGIWLLHAVPLFTIIVISFKTACDYKLEGCNYFEVLLPFKIVVSCILVVYQLFIIAAYIKISLIVKRHINKIQPFPGPIQMAVSTKKLNNRAPEMKNNKDGRCSKKKVFNNKNFLNTTTTIILIVLVFLLCHIPILLNTIYFAIIQNRNVQYILWILRVCHFVCIIINSCFNLYIYIWKLEECKMLFFNTYLSWNTKCRLEAERLRIDIYNIVVRDCQLKRIGFNFKLLGKQTEM